MLHCRSRQVYQDSQGYECPHTRTPVFIAVLKNIVLIPVRISPYDTENELDELYEVFLFVKDKWKTDVSSNTSS